MNRLRRLFTVLAFLLIAAGTFAQQPAGAAAGDTTTRAASGSTIRGCLDAQRGNYIVVEDGTGMVYALKGVGNKLDKYLRHEVEVKGKILPGTIKTGVSSEKPADNPSDAVRAVSGVVFQVADVQKDIHTIAKHCKAAD